MSTGSVATAATGPRPSRGASRTVRWAALAATALAAATGLTACGSPAPGAPAPAVPLVAATSGASSSWASVPMGDLSHRANTFWELFGRVGARWVLSTPPGIATNGGVVAADAPSTSIAAGVVPSFELAFSTVATAMRPGGPWRNGVLPSGLVATPDALATGPGRTVFALLAGATKGIVRSVGGVERWSTLASDRAIAHDTGPRCSLVDPSALAVLPSGEPIVGGRCARGSALPIATLVDGRWRLSSVAGPAHGHATILRLAVIGADVRAIVASDQHGRRSVEAAWRPQSSPTWHVDDPLVLPAGASVTSTTLGTADSTVVVATSQRETAYTQSLLRTEWASLVLPAGSDVMLAGPPPEALAVHHSELLVYARRGTTWQVVQRVEVPIEYGSSS